METRNRQIWPYLLAALVLSLVLVTFLWLSDGDRIPSAQAGLLAMPFQSPLDLSIVKSSTPPGPLTAGDPLTYTIVFSNAGPTTATATITDVIPISLTNVNGRAYPKTTNRQR